MSWETVTTQTASRNLATNATVFSGTVSASDSWFRLRVKFTGLAGLGDDYTFSLLIDGVLVGGGGEDYALGVQTSAIYQTNEFFAPAGVTVQLKVQSPHASDTSVTVSATLFAESDVTGDITDIKAKTDLIGTGFGSVIARGDSRQLRLYTGETHAVAVDTGVTLTGMDPELVFEDRSGNVIAEVTGNDVTLSGTTFTFDVPSELTSAERICNWSLRDATTKQAKAYGIAEVKYLPKKA